MKVSKALLRCFMKLDLKRKENGSMLASLPEEDLIWERSPVELEICIQIFPFSYYLLIPFP